MSLLEFFCRRSLAVLLLAALLLASGNVPLHAAVATYTATGYVFTPPNVDATNFINTGTWNITTTPLPFRTAHTLNYDNSGSMTCSNGWDFGWAPSTVGVRKLSSTFTNENSGVIMATDDPTYGSFLLVAATNLVNKGQLNAGAAGKIQLSGGNVILKRSQVQIQPLQTTGGDYKTNGATSFNGDVGIYDQAWGIGVNSFHPVDQTFVLSDFLGNPVDSQNPNTSYFGDILTGSPNQGVFVGTPCTFRTSFFELTNLPNTYLYTPPGADGVAGANVINGFADWTNRYDAGTFTVTNSDNSTSDYSVPTNMIIQAVYVRVNDANISAQVHFSNTNQSHSKRTFAAAVLLQAALPNLATRATDLASLYLVDTLISETNNFGLATNSMPNLVSGCSGSTYRPMNYTLSRGVQPDYSHGSPGLGTPIYDVLWDASLFMSDIMTDLNGYDPTDSNDYSKGVGDNVQGSYAAYSAYIDNLASEPPPTAYPSLTNFPGEVRIYATNLDLSLARIRAEGELLIQANNLTPTSTNSVVDCQNLSYNIGSTNGFLHFQNLAKTTVNRLNGTINVWSETWTNVIKQVISNDVGDLSTNVIPTTLYVMVVDANSLYSQAPVLVYDLLLHATNILISDQMVVQQNLLLDGSAFTLDSQGSMTLGAYLPNWTYANMPSMKYFTNNGAIAVVNNAHFGDDGSSQLLAFVNRGSIASSGQGIKAGYLEIGGSNDAGSSGEFAASCGSGVLSNATITAGNKVQFNAGSLIVSNSTITAGDLLNFSITNNLSDGGLGANNTFVCANGFNLLVKPVNGELLGTTLNSVIAGGAQVDHVWAGSDYGRNAAGYLNNAAVGSLILTAGNIDYYPLFNFVGSGSKNALYVDTLDISSLGSNWADCLQLADNFKIYYNNVINPSVPNANTALNGQLNGHLIWMGSGGQSTNIIFGLQSQVFSPGGFKLTVGGVLFPDGLAYSNTIIQASTNLITTNWVNIFTGSPPFIFTNFDYTSNRVRFYRAKQAW